MNTPIVLALCVGLPLAVQVAAPASQPEVRRRTAAASVGEVVDAERAFAKLSVEKGQRDAFLAFFADDALMFAPEPVNALKAIEAWPATSKVILDWEPRVAAISADGTLGYTTGPWLRTPRPGQPGATASTGWYFTIWRKHPDGRWRVAVDVGIDGPPAGNLRPSPVVTASGSATVVPTDAGALLAVDREFSRALDTANASSVFAERAAESVRVYRNGLAPIAGRTPVQSYFAVLGARYHCEPGQARIAASADLGYTYGAYRLDGVRDVEAGYYFRVWRQQARAWEVAFDITVPRARTK